MITAEDFTALTGLEVPEKFSALLPAAEELLHARTLQQYRRAELPSVPRTVFKRALAMQIAYMDSRGGLDGWADPSMLSAGVTLGRFSIQKGGATSTNAAEADLLAPGAASLLPTLMAYARAWMDGECP